MEDNEAYELTGGRLQASQIRRMQPEEIAELFARATWFNGRQFDPLIKVFGVSAEAMAYRLISLKLIQ